MKIDIIGVPLSLGSGKNGAQQGPSKMRGNGLFKILSNNCSETYDLGNLYVPEVSPEEMYSAGGRMKYLREIKEVTRNLAEATFNSLAGGAFPIVIGGDHSLSLGSISGASARFNEDIAVVWIDAHGDINTEETSPSGNMHGMPLAALMGHGSPQLTGLYRPSIKVNPRNVFIVGVRSLDKGELALIARENINTYGIPEIRYRGINAVMDDIKGKIRSAGINNVHISLDIDVIDPEFAPGTGTTVEGGMLPEELEQLLDGLIAEKNVRSMDLVELNPLLDRDDMTTKLCLAVLDRVSGKLTKLIDRR